MSAGLLIDNHLRIPPDVDSFDDFRAWANSSLFPESGRIDFIGGQIEIDMAADNIFWHSTPKSEIGTAWQAIAKQRDLGIVCIDKTRVSVPQAELSCEPDLLFVSHEAIESGRVALVRAKTGERDSFVELEGPPDAVAEFVSDNSERKDTERLFHSYFAAGVREYWLIDARGDELEFQIHTRGNAGFVPVSTDANEMQHSDVFGLGFSFTRNRGRNDLLRYDLSFRNSDTDAE